MKASLIFIFLIFPSFLFAHRVSINWVEANVKKNLVTIKAEILPEDFIYFYGMQPDDEGFVSFSSFENLLKQHAKIIVKGLIIINQDGYPLHGTLVKTKVDLKGIKNRGKIDFFELLQRVQTYYIEYKLETKPDYLVFSQMLTEPSGLTPCVVELTVTQDGFAPQESSSLSNDGTVHITKFDWTRKRAAFESLEDERARFTEKKRKEQLGLIQYNSIYSFFYFEPYRVRMELIIPLLILETFIPINRKNPLHISIQEQQALIPKVSQFIKDKNNIKLNKNKVVGKIGSVDFYGLDYRDFATAAKKQKRSLVTARVGIIINYESVAPIENGSIHWGIFSPSIYNVGSTISYLDKEEKVNFSTYASEFSWVNQESAKGVSAVLSNLNKSTKKINEKELGEISKALLAGIYSSFDYTDDLQIFDALALLISPNSIESLYSSIRDSIIDRELGGVQARVDSIEIKKCKKIEYNKKKRAVEIQLEWDVNGQVKHWGHIHSRKNRYNGIITLVQTELGWQIENLNFSSIKPISYEVKLKETPF